MMRLVLGLVATLGLTLSQVQPADACGVKLTVKAPKVKQASRSSNPSQVLVLGNAPDRLVNGLTEAGHSVDVASSPGAAGNKNYRVVVVDAALQDEARQRYPGARIVARSGSTRDNLRAVEDNVARRATGTALAARTPKDTSRRSPRDVGPRLDDRAKPIAAGGGETVATAGGEGAAAGDTPVARGGGDATPAVTQPDPTPTADPTPTREPDRERPTTDVPVKKPRGGGDTVTQPDDGGEKVARAPKGRLAKEVGFGGGSSELSDSARKRLDATAKWLAANPDKSITVEGHASQVGTAEVNQALSEARAQAVKDYLVEQGVDGGRIQTAGYGFDRPAYQPATSARNRRVHIVVN